MRPQSNLVVGLRAIVLKRYKWEQKSDAALENTLVFTQRLEAVPKLCAAHDGEGGKGAKDKKVNKFSGDSGTEVCVPSRSGFQSSKRRTTGGGGEMLTLAAVPAVIFLRGGSSSADLLRLCAHRAPRGPSA